MAEILTYSSKVPEMNYLKMNIVNLVDLMLELYPVSSTRQCLWACMYSLSSNKTDKKEHKERHRKRKKKENKKQEGTHASATEMDLEESADLISASSSNTSKTRLIALAPTVTGRSPSLAHLTKSLLANALGSFASMLL